MTAQQIAAILNPLIAGKDNKPVTQIVVSGNATINNTTNVLFYKNASTTAAVVLTLAANPIDGQAVEIHFLNPVTSLAINANTGQSISHQQAPTSAVAGKHFSYIYILSTQTWLAKH